MKNIGKPIIAVILMGFFSDARSTCVAVDGLIFEKVSDNTALLIRDNKNIGLMRLIGSWSEIKSIRFLVIILY